MRFGGFMIDMDGTVYKGGVPIPGAVEFIADCSRSVPGRRSTLWPCPRSRRR